MQTKRIRLNQPYIYFTRQEGKSPSLELYLLIPVKEGKRVIFHSPTKNAFDNNLLIITCEIVNGKDRNVFKVGAQNYTAKTFLNDQRIIFQGDEPENFGITILVEENKNKLGEVSFLYKDADRLLNTSQKPKLEQGLAINCPYISIIQLDDSSSTPQLRRYQPNLIIPMLGDTPRRESEHLAITSGRIGVCESIITLEENASAGDLKIFLPNEVHRYPVNYLDEKEGGFSAITYIAKKPLDPEGMTTDPEKGNSEPKIDDNLSDYDISASEDIPADSIPQPSTNPERPSQKQFDGYSTYGRSTLFFRLDRTAVQDDQKPIREVRLRPRPKSADNLPKEEPSNQPEKPRPSSRAK